MARKRNIHFLCKCGKPTVAQNSGYCRECKNANQRANRKRHSELSPEQRAKANARSYLNVYIRRGKIKKQPCSVCGNEKAQAHHEDYTKPLEVIWLCKKHHLLHHNPELKDHEVVDRIRSLKGQSKKTCSRCDKPPRKGGRYCRFHHSEYIKSYRLKNKKNESHK